MLEIVRHRVSGSITRKPRTHRRLARIRDNR